MLSLKKTLLFVTNIIKQQRNKATNLYIYEMNKAYIRKTEGSEVFEFTFEYKNPELKVDRKFNFSRKLSESVSTFLGRVATNIEKTLNKKKKKNDDNLISLSEKIFLYQDNIKVNGEILCEDLFNENGDIRLKILDNEYELRINTPWIFCAVLPSSILANFPVYPSKFETFYTDKNLSEFTWFKSTDKNKWIEIGRNFLYTPSNEDINAYLKIHCLPKNSTDCGPITEIVSENKVQADPGQCPFEIRQKFTQNKLVGKNFRVVTYNILADLYSDSDYARDVLFAYCPAYALNMDYRKQLIIKELIGYNADLICLQEVDEKIFDNDLEPVLSFVGFDGDFHKKGGTLREGLACFYNKNRFKKVESLFVVFSEEINKNPIFSEILEKISQNECFIKRLTERTTTLQILLLDSIENDEMLLVANTHFYFHPDADHIRVIQGAMSIIYLQDFKNKMFEKYGKRISVIFCGDFNSTPDCATFKLYTTGSIPHDIMDWQSNTEESIEGIKMENKLLMISACGTPEYTNFTVGFQDCLDYIYCEKSNIEVTEVVPLPSHEELTANSAIPSVFFPSDHISLCADLKWL